MLILNKDVFDYDLTIAEIRLLMVLSSNKNSTVDNLNSKDKLEIVVKSDKYKQIPAMVDKLISLNFLTKNGQGKELKDNFVIFESFSDIKRIKNIRQLFLLSVDRWNNGGKQVTIAINKFKNMFGDTTGRINEQWKRTNQQMGTNYTWKYSKGVIIINEANETDEYSSKIQENTVHLDGDIQFKVPKSNCKTDNIQDTKNQIGEDFEKFYGQNLQKEQYFVHYRGKVLGYKDKGIDLIAMKGDSITLVQCKYWSKSTYIADNVITQTYGSAINILQNEYMMSMEQVRDGLESGKIKVIVATHTKLSPSAKEIANTLHVSFEENITM